MRVGLLLLGTAVLGAFRGASEAQPDSARAARLLNEALTTLGGRAAIADVRTWDLEGRGRENLSAEAQGLAPFTATWREHYERVAVDATTQTVAWERRTPRNDLSVRARRMIFGADRTGMVDHVSGRGMLREGMGMPDRVRGLARRVPHLLLLEAAAEGSRATWVREETANGEALDVVDLTLADSGRLTLRLSRAPVTLRQLQYRTHLPSRGDVDVVWQWDGWRPDASLGMVPARHVVRIAGEPFQEVTYSRYQSNGDVGAMLTAGDTLPRAQQPVTRSVAAANGFAATGEVAPGVHVGSVDGFGVMLVEFPEFVVALETPESHPGLESIPANRPARAVAPGHLAWVRGIAGDRPIRYAVVSHHHSDHLGGVRAFAEAGATILVAPGDSAAARRALEAPHQLTGENAPVRGSVESVRERRVIEAGGRRLEIIRLGENPHTDESLVAWLPNERILFQGDLFYFAANAPFPPSGRGITNRFFAEWLAQRDMAPLAVYGVHNSGVAGAEALARARESGP